VQFDIGHWIEAMRAGIAAVPPVLIAIALLGGPTAGWLLYRFVVQPRNRRMRGLDPSAMWVCPNCRSVNDLRLQRCYRCDSAPIETDLEVIDTHPEGPVPMVAMGPGLNLGGSSKITQLPRPITKIERADDVWVEADEWNAAEAEADRAALPDVAAMTEVIEAPARRRANRPPGPMPVGPGRPAPAARPAPARPRRAVVAGSGPVQDPDDSPAA
jgi:hypothetical protein